MREPNNEPTILLSARWVFLAGLVTIFLGVVGGVIGNYFWLGPQQPVVITRDNDGRPIAAVQEVIISPSKARTEIVQQTSISTLLLATEQGTRPVPFATGLVVTNDGLLVTAGAVPAGDYVALDQAGRIRNLNLVGRDDLFGLTYFRLPDTIIVPLQVRRESVAVGTSLTAITREPDTLSPRAHNFLTTHAELPVNEDPLGIQRYLSGTSLPQATAAGSPLVDEEGLIAGLLVNPAQGKAMSISDLNLSLARVLAGERELDQFAELGFQVQFQIDSTPEEGARFSAVVTSVETGGTAGLAGLKVNDRLVAIAGNQLNWDDNILTKLSLTESYTVAVIRGEQELNLTFHPQRET